MKIRLMHTHTHTHWHDTYIRINYVIALLYDVSSRAARHRSLYIKNEFEKRNSTLARSENAYSLVRGFFLKEKKKKK